KRRSLPARLSSCLHPGSSLKPSSTPLRIASLQRERAAHDFKQELEYLDMPFCLCRIITPGVEAMTPQQEGVRIRMFPESIADAPGQRQHVLRILDNRQPLAVLV